MSRDEHPTLPLADPTAQWVLASPQPPKRPRRVWPWLVAAGVVALLAVGAWFAGEAIARQLVISTVREQIVTNLALPADQPIDVDIPGMVLPQLIGGTLGEVTASSEDVAVGQLAGDVSVTLTDIPVRGERAFGSGTGTLALDAAALQSLLADVEGFPESDVAIDEPDVTVSTSLPVLGLDVPLGLSLTPSAVSGDLVLTPTSVQVAGADIAGDTVSDLLGPLGSSVVRDWEVCVADRIPAGLRLASVAVAGEQVVIGIDIDGAIAEDPALRENGACA